MSATVSKNTHFYTCQKTSFDNFTMLSSNAQKFWVESFRVCSKTSMYKRVRTGLSQCCYPEGIKKKESSCCFRAPHSAQKNQTGDVFFPSMCFFWCVREFNELTKPKCCLWIMLVAKRIIRRKALWMYWGKRDGIYFRPIGVFFWTCQFCWIAINWIRFKLGELT